MHKLLTVLFLTLTVSLSWSQTTPFIDPDFEKHLLNELSGDAAYDNLRWLAHWHRTSGSNDYHEAALFIEKKAKDYGLEDVKIVRHKASNPGWSATMGELWIVEPTEMKLGSYAEYAVALATNSRTTHIRAALVDVGSGTSEKDYEGKDVQGKIVLTSSNPGAVMNEAVWKRGALGVVSYFYHTFPRTSDMVERPDQVAWAGIPQKSGDGKEGTFGFMVSPRKGKMLQEMLKKGPVTVKVDIEAAFQDSAWEEYVEGWIRGSSIPNQHIWLTAHLQEEKPSYNDDGSGCVNILEIGRTLVRLMKEGKIQRPKRDIRFFWADEISSEYQYFSDHPEDRAKGLVNINQDMVGAKQSLGSRIQHITRTPYSIPSYLSDVVENIAKYVILGNTHFLNTSGAGQPQPYSKAILSHLGTRERYGAMVIPYFNSTDHLVFNEGAIGIPGVTLTNMPDDFIHSTDDDAFQIDQTQLRRNAFIAATAAWYIANAGESEIPVLASEVYHTAMKRIHEDVLAARDHIVMNKAKEPEAAYRAARNLVEQAFVREARALESTRTFAGKSGAANRSIDNAKRNLIAAQPGMLDALNDFYRTATGKSIPSLSMTAKERELSRKVPVNNPNLAEYFANRQNVGPVPGLHREMRYEVFNFVNGTNSYLDIFKAVQAEAMSAGSFLYGTVKLEDVETLLDKGVEAKVITLKR
ncbi:MAG TPA: M28 family peptidase [Bacteroidota bacterium]|nr:M28 family peptidase [Bacteroidota bacterium]